MTPSPQPLLVVAGEASGDIHGARLIAELERLLPPPGAAPFGLGGDLMRAAGLDPLAHSAEISVVGITEVWKVLPRARQIFAALLAEVDRRDPKVAVLIDFPDFNLRLARELRARGVRVVYYVSPQVWAWRRGRVRAIARDVERMLVLFPFEVDFYRQAGVGVAHVGHPIVDEVPALPQVWDRQPGPPYTVALLPGSRRSEVAALLPTLLAAARRLAEEVPVHLQVIQAPTIPREMLEEEIALSGLPVRIVAEERLRAVADSHLALCASGTATLEVGLLGTPMIVVYRLAFWTYLLGRLLVRLEDVALVNLVLGRRVVPELIQRAANPGRIAREAARLLGDRGARSEIARMRLGLAELRARLGEGGASRRAAQEVARLLTGPAGAAGATA